MLSKAIRALIKLFYSGEFSKPSDERSWPVMHKAIGDFLAEIFFGGGTCESGEGKKGYLILARQKSKKGKIETKAYPIALDQEQISSFVKIMDALREEINKKEYVHIFLITAVDHIASTFDDTYKEPVEERNILKQIPESGEVIYKWGRNSSKRILQLMDRAAIEGVTKKRPLYSLKDSEIEEMTVDSSYERNFHVQVLTDFGKNYLLEKSGQYPKEKLVESEPGLYKKEVSFMDTAPYFQPLRFSYFIDIVRALLVNFHLAFDDFSRLKICQNPDCRKLFYERREGRGKWCRGACRRKGDPEARDKRKCRERLNRRAERWAERENDKLPSQLALEAMSLSLIEKDDCNNCKEYEKRNGNCLKFLANNRWILSEIEKLRESEKKKWKDIPTTIKNVPFLTYLSACVL